MAYPPLVEALLRPEAYPAAEQPHQVELTETHISWLFLTDRFVYKVKKPVDYGFVDFTTLDRRRFYCHEEVRLNRRLSPEVYLDVVEIRQRDGRLAVGGDGPAVEYAVKMRRLPRTRWLSALLARGAVTPEMVRRIGQRIARFHARAETGEEITRIGGLEGVRRNVAENFEQTAEFVGTTLKPEAYDTVRAYTEAFLTQREGLLRRREREGWIRDCHGDLHADQICLENGIDFIDCIEFNQRFRYGDVAADPAFTAMDLEYWGRPDLAEALRSAYLAESNDQGASAVLRFYECYRAYTRGKVRSFRLRQPGLGADARAAVVDQATRYFDLAHRCARPEGPRLILMTGLMGSGKSVLARALGLRLGGTVLVSDEIRKTLAGLDPGERRAVPWEEGIYAPGFTRRTYEALHQRAAQVLRADGLVILDASYAGPGHRREALALGAREGAPFVVVHTACSDAEARARLEARAAGSAGASDGRVELYQRQRDHYRPPDEISREQVLEIETGGTPEAVALAATTMLYHRFLAAHPA